MPFFLVFSLLSSNMTPCFFFGRFPTASWSMWVRRRDVVSSTQTVWMVGDSQSTRRVAGVYFVSGNVRWSHYPDATSDTTYNLYYACADCTVGKWVMLSGSFDV